MTSEGREPTDVAALSAGVVAVVIALFVTPGVYDIIGVLTSATLSLVIISYAWPRRRAILQSCAVAAVFALCLLPLTGFALEIWYAPPGAPRQAILRSSHAPWKCEGDEGDEVNPCRDKKPISRVPSNHQAVAWGVILLLAASGDRVLQRRRRRDADHG